ncbi:helix-turn-helix domain-containing protein [Paenibacillus sp. B01]|nr:helix-turn-helix domain-containing protein [Paenibacillus sp. B01]
MRGFGQRRSLVPQDELDQVIDYIQGNLFDPMPLERLAKHISYSPSHFARLFKERTGLTPLYYVSSLRLSRAKDLLLKTEYTIRDISLEIGQQSLGTFTTRFTQRVGLTPSEFRQSRSAVGDQARRLQALDSWDDPTIQASSSPVWSEVSGFVEPVLPFDGFVLIGLFAKPIPEGMPIHGTLLPRPGAFRFTGVRPGTYYLMGTTLSWAMGAMDMLLPQTTLRTRARSPIEVGPSSPAPFQHALLYEPRPDDPPILISLPLLMNQFLSRMRG